MRYKIYEMVEPEHLQKVEHDGYDIKTIVRSVLQEMDYSSRLSGDYESVEQAMEAIQLNHQQVKYKKLTILPVIDIPWKGDPY
jgi:hypothetical protein